MEGGTLLQLRNLINRRNISSDISGKFNAAIDFFELVVTGYILAAAMHYFQLSSLKGTPTKNGISPSVNSKDSWTTLKHAVERIVDRYVMVNEYLLDQDNEGASNAEEVKSTDSNPHVSRISHDHNYCIPEKSTTSESAKKKRKLPAWMVDDRVVSLSVQNKAPDGVFNYSSAFLSDGLLLLEFRDGVHFGAGPRVTRCWKFMLLHWRYAKHTKYSLEALHLLAAINATATERIAHELTWCRFINTRGVPGGNMPVDLYMEHLNRTLKDYLKGLGANVSEATITQTSKSFRNLMQITSHFDSICDIPPDSIYHTCKRYGEDLDLVINELTQKSRVFDYIPGHFHRSFKDIKPHISDHIDLDSLFKWIRKYKTK